MDSGTHTKGSAPYGLHIIGLIFFSLYLLGYFFPDLWWSTHFLAFLPNSLAYILFILAAACVSVPFFQKKSSISHKGLQAFFDDYGKGFIFFISLLAAYAMYNFPIFFDYFGDAYKVIARLDQTVTNVPQGTSAAMFSFSLSPWEGHTSILAMITYLAYYLGTTYRQAFLLLDTFCGFFFVLSWLSFIRFYLKSISARLLMGMAVISAPFLLLFFGHIESYALVFLSFSLWLMGILVYLQKKERKLLWTLIPGLLICLKFHPIALLFVPALGLCFLQHYWPKSLLAKKLNSWKDLGKWILLPIFSSGAILYFFVFKDHVDERSLNTEAMAFDHLFLPLFSPEAPLDRYNLLSFNHIFDYFAEILLWSPILLFVLLLLFLYKRNSLNLEKKEVQIIGLSLILFASLFFMLNPLLSMQMDWDMMAIPAVLFLAFGLVLVKQMEKSLLLKKALFPALGILILCVPGFFLHHQKEALGERYISLGKRMFHSYYEWSSRTIQFGLSLKEFPNRNAYEEEKIAILKDLKPYAVPLKDFEYARLHNEEGKYYSRVEKNYDKALQYLLIGENYFPREKNGILYRMETYFLRKDFRKAFQYSQVLIQQQYPSEKKSLAIAVQCALEAGLEKEALDITDFYLNNWQDNQTLTQVNQGIRSGVPLDSLKLLFAQG